jgi:hypothetical protein
MRTCAILELGHRGCCAAADFAAAGAAISQRRVPRFPNDPVLRRCALNRWLILDTAARPEQDNRRRKRPKQPPARTSRGSGQGRHSRRDEGRVE